MASFEFYTNELLKIIGPVKGRRVLDYGAGSGQIAVLLRQAGADIEAVEVKYRLVDELKKRGIKAWHVSDELVRQYDIILMNNAFFYVHPKDRENLLSKFYDLLKPGGRLLLSDIPDFHKRHRWYKNFIKTAWTRLIPIFQPRLGGWWVDLNNLQRQVKKAGFAGSYKWDSWAYYRTHLLVFK